MPVTSKDNNSEQKETLKTRANSILFVGAHPDDIELGCLGTIMKYTEGKKKVFCLIASDGEVGNPNGADRKNESIKALGGAGVNVEDIIFLHQPDTMLSTHERVIFGAVEKLCKEKGIDRIYTHTDKDRHQDHRTVYNVVLGASRAVPDLITFESNSSTLPTFSPNYYINIGPFIKKKVKLLAHHASQADKQYMAVSSITAQARNHGEHSKNFSYAEAFEVVRIAEA